MKYDKKVYEKKRLIKYIEIPIVSFANYSYMFHVFLLILLSYFLNLMIQTIDKILTRSGYEFSENNQIGVAWNLID